VHLAAAAQQLKFRQGVDLQPALPAPRWCAFRHAGARPRAAWLTCCCLAAVPQVCTPCSAAPPPCPIVRSRARATPLRVFPGRSVQRWPRTRRSRDPLQMRARRLCFRPKGQIDPRELESSVGMHIRSCPAELIRPPARFSTATPRPRMQGSAHLAWLGAGVPSRRLVPAPSESHRRTEQIIVGEAIQQVRACYCSRPFCSRPSVAALHASPPTGAHIVVLRAACLCFFSHRSSMLFQRQQLEYQRLHLPCLHLLAPRALLQRALLRLASSAPPCSSPRLLAAASSLAHDHASPILLSALVDPLRLESRQQQPPQRMRVRHACSHHLRTFRPAALPFRFLSSFSILTVQPHVRLARLIRAPPFSWLVLQGLPPLP
jgi:hypothetical protein